MKNKWKIFKKYLPWMFLIFILDGFFCVLFWIANIQAFKILSVVIILFSLLMFFGISFFIIQHENKYQKAFENYILAPTEINEEILVSLSSDADKNIISLIGITLRERKNENDQLLVRVLDYEEYVEAWAHETKIPISLLTILLDNHSDELPDNIYLKMDYIRNRMQEYIDQMLFYARLKGEKKDYFYEKIHVLECIEDILLDYAPLLEEKKFVVYKENLDQELLSDKRGLKFLLSQIISNSIKYIRKGTIPELFIELQSNEKNNLLTIRDNGIGVKECDLPYIFEKGFTGDSGESRKKATGMGLYLVKEIAKDLKLEIEVDSKWQQGFEMTISFLKM